MFESIIALEVNTSIPFNLYFANNIILSGLFLFFLIIDLYVLISAVITRICNPIIEISVSIGISSKVAKAEMEKLQKESYQYNSKLYKPFSASYLLIPFDLFLQLINFLLHLFFYQSKFLIHVSFWHDHIFTDTLLYY